MYLAPTSPISITPVAVHGRRGVFFTLQLMRNLVNVYKTDAAILNSAISIVFLQIEKDELSELNALFSYVKDNIRYTRDVNGFETLADPVTTMRRRVGDCDDKATLLATLAESVGFPTRFVLTSQEGDRDYSHVHAQIFVSTIGWIDADCTENKSLGWSPIETATNVYIEPVTER